MEDRSSAVVCEGAEGLEEAGRGSLQGPAGRQPPCGNTGGKFTSRVKREELPKTSGSDLKLTLGVGWLNFTCPEAVCSEVEIALSSVLGEAVDRCRGMMTYKFSAEWQTGAVMAWTPGRPEAWFSLNAESLACFADAWELFVELHGLGCKATRLDLNVDDDDRAVLDLDVIDAAARAGQVIGFRRYDPRFVVRNVHTGEMEGKSCNFGRRGSDGSGRYVRIYDKLLESKGRNKCIRLEVESSGGVAASWFMILALCESPEEFRRHVARFVGGCIDFRDRGDHKEVDRMARLPWWQRVVDALGACLLSMDRGKSPLQEALKHHEHQWCGKLATLYERAELTGFDGDAIVVAYCRRVVREGRRRDNLQVLPACGEEFSLTDIIGEDANQYIKNCDFPIDTDINDC